MYIYNNPGILVKPVVPFHWMGLGSPPIRIFEKVASQSGNLILFCHMNKKKKTIKISIFVETSMDPRPA